MFLKIRHILGKIIRSHWFYTPVVVVLIGIIAYMVYLRLHGYLWHDITGFEGKTIWDWLVVLIIPGVLAWYIGKKLNLDAFLQEQHAQQKANDQKELEYLEMLKKEIEELKGDLETLKDKIIKPQNDLNNNNYLNSWDQPPPATPVWDTLLPSGELPKLLPPHTLQKILNFYSPVSVIQHTVDLLFSNNLTPWADSAFPRQEMLNHYGKIVDKYLKQAMDPKQISELLQTIGNEIEKINKQKEEQKK